MAKHAQKIVFSELILLALVIPYVIISCFPWVQYNYQKAEVEQYLDEISKPILLNSENDTEKVHQIIWWENNRLNLTPFKRGEWCLRVGNSDKNAGLYVHLRKANCGERAIIFEDMVMRTKLDYRSVTVDALINPSDSKSNNHRWSEVWLDGGWRIADSGFNISYPEKNQSYFTAERDYLIGHVAIRNENGTYGGDCTRLYVNRIGNLIIKAVKDGKKIKDADILITLNRENLSWCVVGRNIDLQMILAFVK